MPTTLVVVAGSAELQLKFLIVEIPPNPLPNFVTNSIITFFLTTFMLSFPLMWLLYLHQVID